ncbi:glycoside hydrolase family 27 protein [Pseudomassariella vexata]|uniref:Alpha-galactosidase n=1 Tax=Pseudomassariella vexata TaxID=1141098 RepID=A0A1Y2DHX2_9PEZI|nr:glycoside hydrolase family 27 protein [Pseudomassariella vexata]ORY58839.1 glycoside hydrolase family 27 protein [Pseudomassariella vexata]
MSRVFLWSLLALPVFGAGYSTTSGFKPQLGWNSWNTFKAEINQELIEETAQSLASTGLAKAGYEYVVMDAGWQSQNRDPEGRQQANASLFPSGIAAVADYIHNLGLKVGIYSDAGIFDCDFHPGSWGYEELDAAMYASWGIDYLKYDNCGGFHAGTAAQYDRFATMRNALKLSGRDIFYSLCQWGHQFPWLWADQISDSYRMSGDIYANFTTDRSGVCSTAYCLNTGYAGVSVLTMIRKMREISGFQKPGAWADMDMLEIGTNTMNVLQEQTHMAFWAALKSPLIIGCDVRNISDSSSAVLTNKDMLAINQDDLGIAVTYAPELSTEGSVQVWGGPLSYGKNNYVILALNYGKDATRINIKVADLPGFTGCKIGATYAKDAWESKSLGAVNGTIWLPGVLVHQTKVILLSC